MKLSLGPPATWTYVSLPSPPWSVSGPVPPVMVSLPAPPKSSMPSVELYVMTSLPARWLLRKAKRSLTVARSPDASAASITLIDSDSPVILIVSAPDTTEIPVTLPDRLALTRSPARLKLPPIVTLAEPIFTTSDVNVAV